MGSVTTVKKDDGDITPEHWIGTGFRLIDEEIDPYGVVAVGGELNLKRLLVAYRLGIFPWPHDGQLVWFCPPQRGILEFASLHIPKRLKRFSKKTDLEFFRNRAFQDVMVGCALTPRRGQAGTWITKDLLRVYCEAALLGFAQSFEAYRGSELIGGLYGTSIAPVFSAESVFAKESDVSKLCLLACVDWLADKGHTWLDVQMTTPFSEAFGARYISRSEFFERLASAPKNEQP